jgi:hypothetical protein
VSALRDPLGLAFVLLAATSLVDHFVLLPAGYLSHAYPETLKTERNSVESNSGLYSKGIIREWVGGDGNNQRRQNL